MWIITERKLREYWREHADAELPLREWVKLVNNSDWTSFSDVRDTFGSADFHNGFTIFNVGGNNFRIIAKIEYSKHIVFIKYAFSHAEYDNHKNWCDCGRKGKSR
jgi:mRNA interferase HigB